MNQPINRPQTVEGMHPQTAMQMGALLRRLAGNPKTRAQTLGLVKQLDPNYRLPADVAVADLENRLKAEREQEKKTEQEERRKTRRANARKELVESHGEEVVKQIEEGVLKKYPHLDYKDAAVLYANENGPIVPGDRPDAQKPSRIWEFPDIPGLMQDPTKAANEMAYSMIDQFRAGRRP